MGEQKRRQKSGATEAASMALPNEPTLHVLRDLRKEEVHEYADKANRTTDEAIADGLAGSVAWMHEIFQQSDLVFGVYPDPSERYGAGVAILKGYGKLKLLSQAKRPMSMRIFHWRCLDIYQAESFCLKFGDGRAALAEAEGKADAA